MRNVIFWFPLLHAALMSVFAHAEDNVLKDGVLFEDRFDDGLSAQWRAIDLPDDQFRIRDGGLEMLVQPGRQTQQTPRLQIDLPFDISQTVVASVEVSVLDRFTEPDESAGLFLIADDRVKFSAEKRRLDGHLVLSPADVQFIGESGNEGDPQQYAIKFWPANSQYGPLRIIADRGYAHFQVGPSETGKYLNFFHSAVSRDAQVWGFALMASGGPTEPEHWVRFDNFKVIRR